MLNKFTEDKILDLPLDEFVKVQGIRLKNYEIRGVHTSGTLNEHFSKSKELYLPNNFIRKVPENAEWVVGYKVLLQHEDNVMLYGTALIPKKGGR